jgi:hypothetical protein
MGPSPWLLNCFKARLSSAFPKSCKTLHIETNFRLVEKAAILTILKYLHKITSIQLIIYIMFHKKGPAIIIFILLLIIGLGAYFSIMQEKLDPYADWDTYRNEAYGYTFKHPKDFTVADTKGTPEEGLNKVIVSSPKKFVNLDDPTGRFEPFSYEISISSRPKDTFSTTISTIDDLRNDRQITGNIPPSVGSLENFIERKFDVNGKPAIYFSQYAFGGPRVYILGDEQIYILVSRVHIQSPEDNEAMRQVFEGVYLSFQALY